MMIRYHQLKQLLLKALSLTKDRTKLVMVQRAVHKPGMKTFIQTFYVRPDQVQKTDHVIAGHHNLEDSHPQKHPQVKFSPEIKHQTQEFFNRFSSKIEAYAALKKMGISWKHTDSAGMNLIRAKLALNLALQSGFVISQQSSPKIQSDSVDIPADATPAQRKLAELVNKMTNIDTIQKCAVMGIVPEDTVAEDFILHTFMDKLGNCIKYGKRQYNSGDAETISATVAQNFYTDMVSMGLDFPNPSQSDKGNFELILKDAAAASNHPDQVISHNVQDAMGWIPFNMDVITNPQSYLKLQVASQVDTNPTILIRQLNQDYYNPNKDVQQDGFVRLLQRIKQENSGDTEVTTEVDKIIDNYEELIRLADSKHNFPGKSSNSNNVATWNNIVSLYNKVWNDSYNKNSVDPNSLQSKVVTLVNQIFGAETTFEEKSSWSKTYIQPTVQINPSRANKIIVANLVMVAAFNRGAAYAYAHRGNSFYVYDTDDEITPEIQAKLSSQLNSVPLYSAEYIDNVNQHYQTSHSKPENDNLSKMKLWLEPEALYSSPLKDVVYKNLSALLSYSSNPLEINYDKFGSPPPTPNKVFSLKDARQQLFNRAKLSLATESMETSDQMRQHILQHQFDYKSGDKDVLGFTYYSPLYNGDRDGWQRVALFNSRFFKVNNSVWEERMTNKIQQLKQQYPDHPEYYEVNQGFHGTSYWSAANILGRDGKFAIGKYVANGTMFGSGIYLGDRLGKSITYVGNESYSMLTDNDLAEDDADGIVMLVDYVKGNVVFQGNTKSRLETDKIPDDATCVLAGPSNSPVKAAEIVIKNNEQICPRYLVDISGRSLVAEFDESREDFEGNIQQDDEGNFGYEDDEGNFEVLYTADGKSIKMK